MKVHSKKWPGTWRGSAVLSVKASGGAIKTDELPPLSSIEAGVGVLKGTDLYHENGYYETIDFIAADITELDKINPPHLANGEKITDFTGSLVILPDRFTLKYGIDKGDTIPLQIGAACMIRTSCSPGTYPVLPRYSHPGLGT